MIVIRESELGIRCDGCTRAARYIVSIKGIRLNARSRLYCYVHTAELLQRAAMILRDDETLHDFIQTEHLMQGKTISG